jgi:SAM-dependent methyltransferase
MVYKTFNFLAPVYDAWFEARGKLIFAIEAQAFRAVLPLLLKPWLEIGVGSGRFAQALRIEIGLDPSVKLLKMARSRGISVFLGRGENSPFRNGSFGAVFLIVTLCFVDSPVEVLREAYRLLHREGKVVLGLVLRESPWGQCYQLKKGEGHRFYKHATFYSYDEVTVLLRQAGFVIERVLSTLFQKPGEVERMESLQEGFSTNAGFTVLLAGKEAEFANG